MRRLILATLLASIVTTSGLDAFEAKKAPASEPILPDACETVALWLFDEQVGLYPSSLLTDAGENDYSVVLGRGGQITPGKFGNALQPIAPQQLTIVNRWLEEQQQLFGLRPTARGPGRSAVPMTWDNAKFCALFTCGERHLRRMEFANPTDARLNVGSESWTVEFWLRTGRPSGEEGTVFEIGAGPREENDHVTRLSLGPDGRHFIFVNRPSSVAILMPSSETLADGRWHHAAFCYEQNEGRVRHWLDGRAQGQSERAHLRPLPHGDESYFSLGRDGSWKHPLNGAVDELRFSTGCRYRDDFAPPSSLSATFAAKRPKLTLQQGPPLLFPGNREAAAVLELGNRKHLFLDDALVDHQRGAQWTPNPPRAQELISEEFRGHLSVIEDDEGVVRLYAAGPHDSLVVFTSTDGVHFDKPDLGGDYHGASNVVIREPVGMGEVFLDPYAPPAERWKYVSGIRNRGMFVFHSPDGYTFTRHETSALPFAAGSQSNVFYGDQRQTYVGYHRSDYGAASATAQESERRFVLTEVQDLLQAWPFTPITAEQTAVTAKKLRIKSHLLDPWYLDNGPLAPGGIGIEFPIIFSADDKFDPPHTDIYVPKACKYPFAPDAYIAFPHFYFHYWDVDDPARAALGDESRRRGSGVIEVQTMVSRDGLKWNRYPRPAYVAPGGHSERWKAFMVGMVQGMVRRGDEIWQYITRSPDYHSAWSQGEWKGRPGVFRAVQRLDGFVSADFDYHSGRLVTKPFKFSGTQLRLNVDTGATGYLQIGILDEHERPIPGFEAKRCIYLNGDFIDEPVEWLETGTDVARLSDKSVRLEITGRGAKLYAMQFTAPGR